MKHFHTYGLPNTYGATQRCFANGDYKVGLPESNQEYTNRNIECPFPRNFPPKPYQSLGTTKFPTSNYLAYCNHKSKKMKFRFPLKYRIALTFLSVL